MFFENNYYAKYILYIDHIGLDQAIEQICVSNIYSQGNETSNKS